MPIGKDSITKRVAKVEKVEENIAPELVATTAAAPKAPAKKTSAAPKTKAPAKAPATKKAPAKKPVAPKEEPTVETTVLSNVAPETVEAVIGHKENEKFESVQIGDELPVFLM